MGNAGSNNMHRERHKSSDLTTPHSPFREVTSGARESVSSRYDKKSHDVDRSVLNGGSDEEQPYYTKTVGSVDLSEYSDIPGSKRKRASTISSVGGTSVDKMSGKGSTESTEEGSDERGEEQQETADESCSTQSEKNINPALPTVLRWDGGGRNVMISGTFSKWKPIPMVRSHGNFVTIIDLPMGDHEYKFCVDGEWKHDPKLKSIESSEGTRNNLVSVRQSDFEVFQALAKDSENVPNYAEKEYSQEVPQAKPWEKISGPPVLPPHLLQVILNKDTPLSCEPTLLPEPNHVMLNHLYALSIKDGVMVLSATHRYRKKYVTTLLYKPI